MGQDCAKPVKLEKHYYKPVNKTQSGPLEIKEGARKLFWTFTVNKKRKNKLQYYQQLVTYRDVIF
jgi:hypothetical protein